MPRLPRIFAFGLMLSIATIAVPMAHALDVATIFSNIGFESGNLSGWTLTQPNADYVSTLTPPVNPSIDPADLANSPTTLVAAVGSYFTGLKRPTDVGPDLKFKVAHTATPVSVPTGTVFTITVWANRGRLEPFDTPASTADVLVRVFGWTGTTTPTVNPATDNWTPGPGWNPAAQSFNFTGIADGTWGSRLFTFDPALAGVNAANIKFLSISIAGRNMNHDQYVAIDAGDAPTPTRPSTWGRLKALYR